MNWMRYLDIYNALSPADRRVADLVGVRENFLVKAISMGVSGKTNRGLLHVHKRFFSALVLYRLVNEMPLAKICEEFDLNRGVLQSMQQQSSIYAGMVTIFCNRLGWTHIERLLAGFQFRLSFGACSELLDLLKLQPILNVQRARALFANGINSVLLLAQAKPRNVTRLLQQAHGREIDEVEAGSLLVERAQEIIRLDLALDYGLELPQEQVKPVSVPVTPKASPPKSVESPICPPTLALDHGLELPQEQVKPVSVPETPKASPPKPVESPICPPTLASILRNASQACSTPKASLRSLLPQVTEEEEKDNKCKEEQSNLTNSLGRIFNEDASFVAPLPQVKKSHICFDDESFILIEENPKEKSVANLPLSALLAEPPPKRVKLDEEEVPFSSPLDYCCITQNEVVAANLLQESSDLFQSEISSSSEDDLSSDEEPQILPRDSGQFLFPRSTRPGYLN
ncbi:hypothetical protein Ciccas_003868 [Cichlidogyrus casuarinus]|uniref:POLQ-like helical domain-containing protein n=1 Tax=Cichlidogyrus casuarinus TaxID=1844966 RepID=A0ABD2QD56_9PLAT